MLQSSSKTSDLKLLTTPQPNPLKTDPHQVEPSFDGVTCSKVKTCAKDPMDVHVLPIT